MGVNDKLAATFHPNTGVSETMTTRINEPAANPSESKAQRAVRLRREYDAEPNGEGRAKAWLAAEQELSEDQYEQYRRDYKASTTKEQE